MTTDERCNGSGQLAMDADTRRAQCPVCKADVAVLNDGAGRAVIVDHKPRRDDALPMGLGL